MIKVALLLLGCGLLTSVWAVEQTPLLTHSDSSDQREFQNIYQAITSPTISTGTANTLTITSATITNLTVTGTLTTLASLGKLVQILIYTTQTGFTTTSSSFVNTNSSGTITPTSSSNKVLILASTIFQDNSPNATGYITLARGGSNLGGSRGFAKLLVTSYSSAVQVPATLVYLDSPASTSQLTYTVQIRNDDGATTMGWGAGTNSDTQVMILAEVAP